MSTTKDLRSLSLLELLSELKAALDKPKAEPRGSKYTPDSEEENESKPEDMRHSDPAETSVHGRPGWNG
jgi:hypothetical protein